MFLSIPLCNNCTDVDGKDLMRRQISVSKAHGLYNLLSLHFTDFFLQFRINGIEIHALVARLTISNDTIFPLKSTNVLLTHPRIGNT